MGSQGAHDNLPVTRQGTSMDSGNSGRKGTSMGGFGGKFGARAASKISSSLSRVTLESSMTMGTLQNMDLDDEALAKVKAMVNK